MADSGKQNWRANGKALKSHVISHGSNQQVSDKRQTRQNGCDQ
jgi:hypothetical protein